MCTRGVSVVERVGGGGAGTVALNDGDIGSGLEV